MCDGPTPSRYKLLIADNGAALCLPESVNANVNEPVPLHFTYLLCVSNDCFDFVVYNLLNSSSDVTRKFYFREDEAYGIDVKNVFFVFILVLFLRF